MLSFASQSIASIELQAKDHPRISQRWSFNFVQSSKIL